MMTHRHCPGIIPIALALVLFCAPALLAAPGDDKKTDETPSKSKKTDVKDEKTPEAKSVASHSTE